MDRKLSSPSGGSGWRNCSPASSSHRPGAAAAQLSGGQQKRVAWPAILASQPKALLLDEPFSALDSYLKWRVELGSWRSWTSLKAPPSLR